MTKKYHNVSAAFEKNELGVAVHQIFKEAGGKLVTDEYHGFEREIEYKVPIATIATVTKKIQALDDDDMCVYDVDAKLAIDMAYDRGLEIFEEIKALVNAEKKADRGHIFSMIFAEVSEIMVESGYWTAEELSAEMEVVARFNRIMRA